VHRDAILPRLRSFVGRIRGIGIGAWCSVMLKRRVASARALARVVAGVLGGVLATAVARVVAGVLGEVVAGALAALASTGAAATTRR
jgi:hypothetical protein